MHRLLLVPALFVFAACSTGGASDPSPAATPGARPEDVAGAWELVEIGDAPVGDLAMPTLEITDSGLASGFAGCNQYSGSVMVSATEIRFGPLASTKMACAEPIDRLEMRYLQALAEARTWTIGAEGSLTLEGGERLVFRPAAAS